jgi:hypothetical protein
MIRPAPSAPLTAALVAFLLCATPVFAQIIPVPETPPPSQDEIDEAAAYLALSTTPVGALAPIVEIPGLTGNAGRLKLHAQFGLVEEEGPFSTRNFALGLGIQRERAAVRLTGGVADFMCDDNGFFGPGDGVDLDCGMGFFGGVDATFSLMPPVLPGSSGSSFTANLAVSLGASSNDISEITLEDPFDPSVSDRIDVSATAFSAAVGVPLAFVVKSGDVVVTPHLTPRVGYGRARTKIEFELFGEQERLSERNSDILPMLGAGVDIQFGSFGLGLGVHKIFAEESEMAVGINFSFRRR